MTPPRLTWDLGTAYDFFISLYVLHEPSKFGLRGVWAAGMRSRLPAAERDFLEEVQTRVAWGPPLHWIYTLPEPKDALTALRVLEQLPPAERLPALVFCCPEEDEEKALAVILKDVAARQEWDDEDLDALREAMQPFKNKGEHIPSRKDLTILLDWWVRVDEFGERYLKALRAYYEVFFAEEERRIYPALKSALERAQALAAQLSIADLLVELSQGVSFDTATRMDELVLAPAYWNDPLVFFDQIAPNRMLLLFGGRPADASLVPGELVPDALLRALKALADPTRLKILNYLAAESLTPTQLASRLRLRAPTVVHHLQTLRVAGLVQVTVSEGKERSYTVRSGSVQATCEALARFLGGSFVS